MLPSRLKNRLIARIITTFPSLSKGLVDAYTPWESEDIPWTAVSKPLAESAVTLVTTSGVHHRDQEPFNMKDPFGDPSFRTIDAARPGTELMITHDYYDHRDADRDMNIVFPLDRLDEMEKEGFIGSISRKHYSFMGHIDGPYISTLIEKTAPAVASRIVEDGADVVLLTPGWAICNQSVGLVQREIERRGIPTIGISIVRQYTEKVKPPRSVFLKWPFGHPLGEPFHTAQHRAVLKAAFDALENIKEPGTIIDLPFRWRREKYD